MIRILHTIDTTGPGGAETVFVDLIKGLDPNRFVHVVVIRGPGWVFDQLTTHGLTPYFINSRGSFNVKYLMELVNVIKKEKVNLIQSHLLGSNLYCSLAGILTGIPVVSTFHGFVDFNANEKLSRLKTFLINRGSNKLVFVSDSLKKRFVQERKVCDSKSVVIYNAVVISQCAKKVDYSYRKSLGFKNDVVVVGSVGNIRVAKGYSYLLQAAKTILQENPHFRFLIAGEGKGKLLEELMTLRHALGLQDVVYFLGFQADIPTFLNNLDIFVLSSMSEGFSIATIEAMVNGILVTNHDPSGLARAIIELSTDSELKKRLTHNALLKVKSQYSSEVLIDKYTALYESILLKEKFKVPS